MPMNVGIDLLWVRPGKVGGTESFIRNLLSGFQQSDDKGICFNLFCAKDNVYEFSSFLKKGRIQITECKVNSKSVCQRVFYENIRLYKLAKQCSLDLMYIPIYSMPYISREIPCIVTIHDLQALHYPQYFSPIQRAWLAFSWKRSIANASHIVAISNYVKKDIVNNYNINNNNISVIYNPVVYKKSTILFSDVEKKYGVRKKDYLYTVSSLLPHKNLITLLRLIRLIKQRDLSDVPSKLVISGIGAGRESEFCKIIASLGIEDRIVLTGYISTEERNALMENTFAFLFPSLFEGFGMPPVEAMMAGIHLITTKSASIPEVTDMKANYVENPEDPEQWLDRLRVIRNEKISPLEFKQYSVDTISSQYLKIFREKSNKVSTLGLRRG